MRTIGRRVRQLKELLRLRIGPGAAYFPKHVTRLHLSFAQKADDGHKGPRYFWREILPRLKYHNPAVPMSISRPAERGGDASLFVYMQKDRPADAPTPATVADTPAAPADASSSPAAAPAPAPTDRAAFRPVEHDEEIIDSRPGVPGARAGEERFKMDVRHLQEGQIWQRLAAGTGARELVAGPGELKELEDVMKEKREAERIGAAHTAANVEFKRKKAMLAGAMDKV